mmetsp:Transcript_8618/g.28387  ORF Transcript_8618/g.28387 Transcript_8618/m.28387 type:complete len:453 (+) Transcript_8618:1158-2516(+)
MDRLCRRRVRGPRRLIGPVGARFCRRGLAARRLGGILLRGASRRGRRARRRRVGDPHRQALQPPRPRRGRRPEGAGRHLQGPAARRRPGQSGLPLYGGARGARRGVLHPGPQPPRARRRRRGAAVLHASVQAGSKVRARTLPPGAGPRRGWRFPGRTRVGRGGDGRGAKGPGGAPLRRRAAAPGRHRGRLCEGGSESGGQGFGGRRRRRRRRFPGLGGGVSIGHRPRRQGGGRGDPGVRAGDGARGRGCRGAEQRGRAATGAGQHGQGRCRALLRLTQVRDGRRFGAGAALLRGERAALGLGRRGDGGAGRGGLLGLYFNRPRRLRKGRGRPNRRRRRRRRDARRRGGLAEARRQAPRRLGNAVPRCRQGRAARLRRRLREPGAGPRRRRRHGGGAGAGPRRPRRRAGPRPLPAPGFAAALRRARLQDGERRRAGRGRRRQEAQGRGELGGV